MSINNVGRRRKKGRGKPTPLSIFIFQLRLACPPPLLPGLRILAFNMSDHHLRFFIVAPRIETTSGFVSIFPFHQPHSAPPSPVILSMNPISHPQPPTFSFPIPPFRCIRTISLVFPPVFKPASNPIPPLGKKPSSTTARSEHGQIP